MKDFKETPEHPSYGLVQISRVQGRRNLFGSPFEHQHYVTLTIRRARHIRYSNRDHYHGDAEMIEVALSEAQYAQLISTPNMGQGVPCTIQSLQGQSVERPPRHEGVRETAVRETRERMEQLLGELQATVDEAREKGRINKDLGDRLGLAVFRFKDSIPFIHEQFEERVEETLSLAKTEINAYMAQTVQRLGLRAANDDNVVALIEENK